MLKLLSDADVHGHVVKGGRKRKPNIDLLCLNEIGMRSADDSEILQWAAAANRIVITQDRATMIGQALNRVAAGQSVPGLFILRPRTPNQGAIEAILLAEECSNQEEWRNRVEFLPL